jgi:5-deoxy-glucuronate isomerase
MARSKLLVRPRKSANGLVHRVTPKTAGWTYVGFEARDLKKGGRHAGKTGKMEACVVLLSGKARITTKDFDSGVIGERASVFEGPPWSVYLPAGVAY